MICKGCYKEVKGDGYCLPCRKRLFDGDRVPAVLAFDAPRADNFAGYQEYSRQMSVSGVQLKYALSKRDKALALCTSGGEYILKPVPPGRQLAAPEHIPENEHLTMQIAAQVFSIRTAANALIYFRDGQPAYITRRFDIQADGGKFMQEDFAQLLQRSRHTHGEAYKYEGSYEEIGRVIGAFAAAAMPALEAFFQLIVFNYVFSNGDAHLKNFSLARDNKGEYRLAPAYDLISTVIHTPHESDTALDLYPDDIRSDHYSAYGCYGRANFMELAGRLGIKNVRAGRIIQAFHSKQAQTAALVHRSFLPPEVREIYLARMEDKLRRIV